MSDKFIIGGKELTSRLFIGTGKYSSNKMIPEIIEKSGSNVITMAVRRVDFQNEEENVVEYIPKDMILLPNTSGARNAEEAVRIARLAKAMGCGNWIKIEVINDSRYSFIKTLSVKLPELSIKKHSLNFLVYPIPCTGASKLN